MCNRRVKKSVNVHSFFVREYTIQFKSQDVIVEMCIKKISYEKCRTKFRIIFPIVSVPSKSRMPDG